MLRHHALTYGAASLPYNGLSAYAIKLTAAPGVSRAAMDDWRDSKPFRGHDLLVGALHQDDRSVQTFTRYAISILSSSVLAACTRAVRSRSRCCGIPLVIAVRAVGDGRGLDNDVISGRASHHDGSPSRRHLIVEFAGRLPRVGAGGRSDHGGAVRAAANRAESCVRAGVTPRRYRRAPSPTRVRRHRMWRTGTGTILAIFLSGVLRRSSASS